MEQIPLKIDRNGLMIGCILGDGYMRIQKNGKNANLEIGHSLKQEEYLIFKSNLLKEYFEIDYKISKRISKNKNGKEYPVIYSIFPYSNIFTSFYYELYRNKVKTLSGIWNNFDETSLVLLFLDDGSAKIKNRVKRKDGSVLFSSLGYIDSFNIAMNSFSFFEVSIFSEKIKEMFGIDSTIQKDRNQPRLAISRIESKKILVDLVNPYMKYIPNLNYKISKPLSMSLSNFK